MQRNHRSDKLVAVLTSWLPSATVEKVLAVLSGICLLLALAALGDLAIRAVLRLEIRWDTFMYHLPFAALRGGLHLPYDMNDTMRLYYQGFPPLPHFLQGILWRMTGSVNATGVVNYLAFLTFLLWCHRVLQAPFWLVALIALTAPMVVIHATVSYVDLFGNSGLAIGISSCLSLLLFPQRATRRVIWCGYGGFIGAAWSKYQLVPVVALSFCLFTIVAVGASRKIGVRWQKVVLLHVVAALLAALPYIKNFAVYGNPFWPVHMPILSQLFPYTVDVVAETALAQRPPPLKEYSRFRLFIHSLFEINHLTRYEHRPRWIIDQGNAWIAFRMGGFWGLGVAVYLVTAAILLVTYDRRLGLYATVAFLGILCFVAILPQSHELRYYLFIPLVWASTISMMFPNFQEKWPRTACVLLIVVVGLFSYMVAENWVHYQISKIDYEEAARRWGAPQWWDRFQRGKTYCVVDMMPVGLLLTGPTMSEYTIVDRSKGEFCPDGSRLVTKDGIQGEVSSASRAAAKNPAHRHLERKSAEEYLNESLALYQTGKYRESLIACDNALSIRPNYAEAYNNMCASYNAMGRWEEAITTCTKAIELQPDFALAKKNLAWSQMMKATKSQ